MARRHGVKMVADAAQRAERKRVRDEIANQKANNMGRTLDNFQNFVAKMGRGTDNMSSAGTYGFNPISRQRVLLEWMHRGSWIAGQAVDVIAKDMTRGGITLDGQITPEDTKTIERSMVSLKVWQKLCETIQWGRLYGGCLAVMLIDGQELSTPLRLETIGKGQFKGLLVLDRWMVQPSLENLVTDFGPDLGTPKYYRVLSNAPAIPKESIHHTRCIRLEGVNVPYQQRLMENLWTISVLERLYDRMLAFDSATTGVAQLVYKCFLRTFSVTGMKELVSAGGTAEGQLMAYVQAMARFQGIEGISVIDAEDKLEATSHTAFSGLGEALSQLAQQLSGALEIPLVRLFGQSPSGFSSGDNEVRNYYDGINQKQETELRIGITRICDATARSCGIVLGDDFSITFNPLWQLTEKDKSEIAKADTETALSAEAAGMVSQATVLKELKQSSHTTGRWTNITDEDIEAADTEVTPPDELAPAPGEGGDPFGKKNDEPLQDPAEKKDPTSSEGAEAAE